MFETKLTELCQLIDQIKTEFPQQIPYLPGFFRGHYERLNNYPKRNTANLDLKLIEKIANHEEFTLASISTIINSQEKVSEKAALEEIRVLVTVCEDYNFRKAVVATLNRYSSGQGELLDATLKLLFDATEVYLGELQTKAKQQSDPFLRYYF